MYFCVEKFCGSYKFISCKWVLIQLFVLRLGIDFSYVWASYFIFVLFVGIILHICLIFGHHTIIFTISAHPGNISSYFWDSYFYLSYFWASYFIRSYFCTSYFLPVLLFVVIFMCILFLGSYIWVVLLLWSLMTSAYINMGWLRVTVIRCRHCKGLHLDFTHRCANSFIFIAIMIIIVISTSLS